MRFDSRDIHRRARRDRAVALGTLLGRALAAAAQLVSKAWRSSSSQGTRSKALS
jgi:hypothetical protein